MNYNGTGYAYDGYGNTLPPPRLEPVPVALPGSRANGPVSVPVPYETALQQRPIMSFLEHGRHYDSFRPGKYMFPMDAEEMDRMDIFHKLFQVARSNDSHFGGLYQRPIPSQSRILDLGCGSGIWAIETAEHNAQAHILGWDLSLIQPLRIPPNVVFERRDMEEPWTGIEENSFDLIHMRMLLGSIAHWPWVYGQVFRHLIPGSGLLEHVEIDFRPLCEKGGKIPLQGSKLDEWSRELHEAMSRCGRPMEMESNTAEVLQGIGFVDIEHIQKRVPFNPWSDDPHEKEMGKWFNLAMTQGLEALALAPLTRKNGYSKEKVTEMNTHVRKEICSRELRAYCTMHIWTARRPPLPGRRA
ncbi:Uu.00g028140.m01.CDS01 [Anthostomella pinea]|uniref:Uu.00g028140.m01.CDS01 n=1 Tax=Anthostomella pinea TaxID=933095 RepID=A0AAI8V8V9_9PEZI|nr:Uu.00g028140.m01.CDS01 [Anthostomella pinea]